MSDLLTPETDVALVRKYEAEYRNVDSFQMRQRYGDMTPRMFTDYRNLSRWDRICEVVLDRVLTPLLENPKVRYMPGPCSLVEVENDKVKPIVAVSARVCGIDWTLTDEEIENALVDGLNTVYGQYLESCDIVALYQILNLQGPIFGYPNKYGVLTRFGRYWNNEEV